MKGVLSMGICVQILQYAGKYEIIFHKNYELEARGAIMHCFL